MALKPQPVAYYNLGDNFFITNLILLIYQYLHNQMKL